MPSESPTEKVYVDWGKLLQIVIIVAATVSLALADKISPDAVMIVLGAAAGYVFGNGKSVRAGHAPAGLLYRGDESEDTDDPFA